MEDGDDDGKIGAADAGTKQKMMIRDRSSDSGPTGHALDSQGQPKVGRADAMKATRMPPSKSTNQVQQQRANGGSRSRGASLKAMKSEREGNFLKSKQMQFGDDKKLQPSDISDLEKRGMITFTSGGTQIAPYLMDKSGTMIALGQKTRNQGTAFGELTADGGDQAMQGQLPPHLAEQGKDANAAGQYSFQNQIVQ